ncbi:Signal transduction histidine-protein kinase BaeS [Pantoea agglomerans]|uniref:histidine kinase n=1 Tax=Enterobacter agglomerans TaxID=549 RepID=A0A379LSL4_ENTAG|nr:Signal transduction histidine-protein kinase BaeS [Pantoea agglomerans]
MSLADAGQLTLNHEWFNLSELLRERSGWLLPQAEQAGIAISVTSPNDLRLYADTFRLGQVVTIICENAMRYAADGGALLITASRNDQAITMTFRDYGQGVEPDFLPQLFDRFTRADSLTRPPLRRQRSGTVDRQSDRRGARRVGFTPHCPPTAVC